MHTLAVDVRLVSRLEGKLRSLGMRIGSFPPSSFLLFSRQPKHFGRRACVHQQITLAWGHVSHYI